MVKQRLLSIVLVVLCGTAATALGKRNTTRTEWQWNQSFLLYQGFSRFFSSHSCCITKLNPTRSFDITFPFLLLFRNRLIGSNHRISHRLLRKTYFDAEQIDSFPLWSVSEAHSSGRGSSSGSYIEHWIERRICYQIENSHYVITTRDFVFYCTYSKKAVSSWLIKQRDRWQDEVDSEIQINQWHYGDHCVQRRCAPG